MIFFILFIFIMLLSGCDSVSCRKVILFENEQGFNVSNCINKNGNLNNQWIYKDNDTVSYVSYATNEDIDSCHFWFKLNYKNDLLFIKDSFTLKIIYDTITYNRFYDGIRVDVFKDEKNLFGVFVPEEDKANINNKALPNGTVFKIKISPFIKKEGNVHLGYTSDSVYVIFDE